MTDEEFVRSNWDEVELKDHTECCGPFEPWRVQIREGIGVWASTAAAAWSAAREYTATRKEEIRQKKREITSAQWICDDVREMVMRAIIVGNEYGAKVGTRSLCLRSRILAQLESALAELTRGWKGQA